MEVDAEPVEVSLPLLSEAEHPQDEVQAAAEPGPSSSGPAPGPGLDVVRPPLPMSASSTEPLPRGWMRTLPVEQHEWLGRAMFRRQANGRLVLTDEQKMWWHPPGARPNYTQPPATAHAFFQRPFFLWLPYRRMAYDLRCHFCGNKLTGAGLYKTVRRVLDRDGWYFVGTEYLECSSCHKKVAGWSQVILKQLDISIREEFPAVLTYKLACDKKLVGHLKERTLGNSATRLHQHLLEEHSRWWMLRSTRYLSVLRKLQAPGAAAPANVSLPAMHPVPSVSWLISVYVRDVVPRLDENRARITSIFGDILKMESTKKVTKKLAGAAADTAACVTNVGNEHGQVLMSVLTAAQGDGLANMAAGLMRRYSTAGKAPPRVLYVSRDCCVTVGTTKLQQMFHEWHELVVRLDIWHLMARLARGVTNESHQLYGLFMARLSFAIFAWDRDDLARLTEAKQSKEGRDARVKLSARELARHCRRRTRGAAETARLIQELLGQFWNLTDSLGVPLIDRSRMEEIWSTQRCHLDCIQDPEGVSLYTKTGEITMGGVRLPVFRCARGTTSLESFHLHLSHFIPGTSASDVHFQVYLLEGLVRWNENRGRAAVEGGARTTLRCYSAELQHSFSQLTQQFLGCTLVENYTQPREYTGELIGVEYLYSQTGAVLQQLGDPDAPDGTDEVEEDWSCDEGIEEEEDVPEDIRLQHEHSLVPMPGGVPVTGVAATSPSQSGSTDSEQPEEVEEEVIRPDVRPPACVVNTSTSTTATGVHPPASAAIASTSAAGSGYGPPTWAAIASTSTTATGVRPPASAAIASTSNTATGVRPPASAAIASTSTAASGFGPSACAAIASTSAAFKGTAAAAFDPPARAAIASTSAAAAGVGPPAPSGPLSPGPIAAGAAGPAGAAGAVPRTTAWRHKCQQEAARRAQELGQVLKNPTTIRKFTCQRCGQPKNKTYGHSRYRNITFCAASDPQRRTVQQWLEEMRQQEGAPPPP